MKACIVTHGGVGAKEETKDGPDRAAAAGKKCLLDEMGSLEAAVRASVVLEDDPRFNAGTGSRFCIDGKTIEPYTPPIGWYATDAFTDYALKWLDEPECQENPFFLYLSYTRRNIRYTPGREIFPNSKAGMV